MATTTELRALYEDLAAEADARVMDRDWAAVAGESAQPPTMSAGRARAGRPLRIVLAAATVVGLAVGATLAAAALRPAGDPSGGRSGWPVRFLPFGAAADSGWTVGSRRSTSSVEPGATFVRDHVRIFIDVISSQARLRSAEATGRQVAIGPFVGWYIGARPQQVVWQYAPDHIVIATLTGPHRTVTGPAEAAVLSAARAFDPSAATRMKTAFKLDTAPPGAILTDVAQSRQFGGWSSTATWTVSNPHQWITVTVSKTAPKRPGQASGTPTTVAGHPAWWFPRSLTVRLGHGESLYLQDGSDDTGRSTFTEQQMIDIASHITLADSVEDRSTWFDAATALP